ncbi:MAG: tRNA (adenosine(37)-N6)-dimethylallyltransferase MiaA [Gammaproteobacteria bacterium]|nr:tRNA (adenosine(37)-N6)-dimethylallyltransferase MiaA [Gammaproteobacteria bacterium]
MTALTTEDKRPLALFIMGPTAAGKTALAVELVQRLPCDIISVDSAMVYRGLDIGAAKPDAATLARAPHRLIDLLDPSEAYSVSRFCADARAEMDQIVARGRIPLLVGGSMLYFRALELGLSPLPKADAGVRAELNREIEQRGLAALHGELAQVDPVAAERIHSNDSQRIQRALEVWRLTGKTLTQLQQQAGEALPFRLLKWALSPPDRAVLHQRIAQRFEQMLAQGFIDEVRELKARPELNLDLPSMRSIGYRQVWQHLDGELNEAELLERGIIATRQFAKRQLTWLRSYPEVVFYDPENLDYEVLLRQIV